MKTEQERIIQWLCSGETGLSSKTMVCIHTGNEMGGDWDFMHHQMLLIFVVVGSWLKLYRKSETVFH